MFLACKLRIVLIIFRVGEKAWCFFNDCESVLGLLANIYRLIFTHAHIILYIQQAVAREESLERVLKDELATLFRNLLNAME